MNTIAVIPSRPYQPHILYLRLRGAEGGEKEGGGAGEGGLGGKEREGKETAYIPHMI